MGGVEAVWLAFGGSETRRSGRGSCHLRAYPGLTVAYSARRSATAFHVICHCLIIPPTPVGILGHPIYKAFIDTAKVCNT